jgi:GT2 family glycosyltransferase
VYDDGSTDGTYDFLKGEVGVNGHLVDGGDNIGLPAADNALREYILKNVDAEYIAWLAADDWWRKDKIALQVNYMAEHEVDVCYTDTIYIMGNTRESHAFKAPDFDFNRLCANNFINGSSVLFKRALLEAQEWDATLKNCEDWDFWLRAHKDGYKFGRLGETATANLRHAENISGNRVREAYYHAKVCIKHGIPIEIAAARIIMYKQPAMIRGIVRAWHEEGADTQLLDTV